MGFPITSHSISAQLFLLWATFPRSTGSRPTSEESAVRGIAAELKSTWPRRCSRSQPPPTASAPTTLSNDQLHPRLVGWRRDEERNNRRRRRKRELWGLHRSRCASCPRRRGRERFGSQRHPACIPVSEQCSTTRREQVDDDLDFK